MTEQRWFLSYHSQDQALAERFRTALNAKCPDASIYFAPTSLRAGGYWLPELAKAIAEATVFVLLVGEHGLGPWQVTEYYDALDRRVKEPAFPLIPILLDGQLAPGLPFLRQLHWIITSDPASEKSVGQVLDASHGVGTIVNEPWRHTAPYRGLAAMTEADSDFFFGRVRETVKVLKVLATEPDRIPILLGNSGVGKSSLARAGVVASLMREAWPDSDTEAGPWPQALQDGRRWCFLTLRPGTEPVNALVEAFLQTWQLDPTEPSTARKRREWVNDLVDDKVTLRDLLDQTRHRYAELQQSEPPAYFLYVDQGEELFVRSEERQRRRFSELLAASASDRRLYILITMRSDFFGELQRDAALWKVHEHVNVAPMQADDLHEVVFRPASLLGARFDTERLADDIARRAAEESTKDAGALPLLSYLLDDMWRAMVERGENVLRLPAEAIELGGVLVERANAFVEKHPGREDELKRILTLKLATVREDGEPTRRRASRSEFSNEEWLLVSELADHPNRLLNIITSESGETYAEIAHEAVFRRWDILRNWIASEREFLAWRSGLEASRRAYDVAPADARRDALLMGFPLATAAGWFSKREMDIPRPERAYIRASVEADRVKRWRTRGLAVAGAMLVLIAWFGRDILISLWRDVIVAGRYQRSYFEGYGVSSEQMAALRPGGTFRECKQENGRTDRCPEMVVIPAGFFMMGSPATEKGRHPDESPRHRVVIARPFAVSKYPVTFAEWDDCVTGGGCNGYHPPDENWGHDNHPVINVSWYDANAYAKWLSKMTRHTYRLLSEAEYEYATRAGTTATWFWGDDGGKQCTYANGADLTGKKENPDLQGADCPDGYDYTSPVGTFQPNAFGLYDMLGNVWEWTEDCWNVRYNGAPTDGSAWQSGICTRRVLRGGSWADKPQLLRAAYRNWGTSSQPDSTYGFRLARAN